MDLHQTQIIVRGVSSFFFLIILFFGASNANADCFKLYSQKQYSQAADCFYKKARALGPVKSLGEVKKLKKGRTIRNAMLCLQKAINKTRNSEKIASIVEKSSKIFSLYKREKLYENSTQLKRLAKIVQDFQRKIGYGRVTIVNNHKGAKSCVVGTHFSKCKVLSI